MDSHKTQNKPAFEPSLHAFRGFAILNVVAVHTFGFILYHAKTNNTGFNVDFLDRANEVLFHDATIYFTLISGVLFSLVLLQRGWKAFFRSKMLNVFLPYVFMSCLFTWSHWAFDGYKLFDESIGNYVLKLWHNILIGDGIFTFWYIPVLLVLYILTPLLVEIMKRKALSYLLIPIVILPLFFSRVWPQVSWTTYVYFLGVYTLGLYFGAHYKLILEKIQQYVWLIVGLGLLATVTLWFMYVYEIKNWGIISLQESLFYIQKLAFACLVLWVFKRFVNAVPQWLNTLGNYAFPIYFLHAYFLFEAYDWFTKWIVKMTSIMQVLFICGLGLFLTLAICIVISMICKRIFGSWTKYFIGA